MTKRILRLWPTKIAWNWPKRSQSNFQTLANKFHIFPCGFCVGSIREWDCQKWLGLNWRRSWLESVFLNKLQGHFRCVDFLINRQSVPKHEKWMLLFQFVAQFGLSVVFFFKSAANPPRLQSHNWSVKFITMKICAIFGIYETKTVITVIFLDCLQKKTAKISLSNLCRPKTDFE